METTKQKILTYIQQKNIHPKTKFEIGVASMVAFLGILVTIIFLIVLFFTLDFLIVEYKVAHTLGIVSSSFLVFKKMFFWIGIFGAGICILVVSKQLQKNTPLYKKTILARITMIFLISISILFLLKIVYKPPVFSTFPGDQFMVFQHIQKNIRPYRPQGVFAATVISSVDDIMHVRTKYGTIIFQIPPYEQIMHEYKEGDRIIVYGYFDNGKLYVESMYKYTQ